MLEKQTVEKIFLRFFVFIDSCTIGFRDLAGVFYKENEACAIPIPLS
jgi:hypothetical protein